MMNFYQSLGYLIFGSRLKRLSEYFLSEINEVYKKEGIEFDASWFPVFYLLSEHQPVAIQELSETMVVSHSAASQLVTTLKNKGLVSSFKNPADGRKQEISLTQKGEELLKQLLPVWDAINATLTDKIENTKASKALLKTLTAAENKLQENSLAESITGYLKQSTALQKTET
jgi:DNA-binding MarR family transcriptional regulator